MVSGFFLLTDRAILKRYLPFRTYEPPGKATFIATLRCEIVAERVVHKLTYALAHHWPPRSETADADSPLPHLKEKRSRDCDRTSRPQTLAGLSPTALGP